MFSRISGIHFVFGTFLGIGLLIGIWRNAPDGKLHVVFCNVGQGDAIYLRLPDQTDVLVDGGPNNRVLSCLGSHMPFYDRTIDMIIMTHPQKDHLQGLVSVLERYTVKHFVTVPVAHTTEGYKELQSLIAEKKVPVRLMTRGGRINSGNVKFDILWPDQEWLIETLSLGRSQWSEMSREALQGKLNGKVTDLDLNVFSLYTNLSFGKFDLLLTGDGDQKVQDMMKRLDLYKDLPADIEVLKVPHHGSKTGLTDEMIALLSPDLSVIQVGKNNYGHPNKNIVEKLKKWGRVVTTENREIEVVSDGKKWWIL